MTNRSLTTVVKDTFTAPRWVHYLFKIFVGLVALGFIYPILRADLPVWWKAVLLSFLWFLSIRVSYALDHSGQVITFSRDFVCDCSLHLIPCALISIAFGYRTIGIASTIILFVLWLITYPEASP